MKLSSCASLALTKNAIASTRLGRAQEFGYF